MVAHLPDHAPDAVEPEWKIDWPHHPADTIAKEMAAAKRVARLCNVASSGCIYALMNTKKPPLPIIKTYSPRNVWPLEVQDFNAWLARKQGTQRLAAAIGCDLKHRGSEVKATAGRSDLLFDMLDPVSDQPSGQLLVVESTLLPADNDHFARLLHYAAAAEARAVTAVLLAPRFSQEILETISRYKGSLASQRTSLQAVQLDIIRQARHRHWVGLTQICAGTQTPEDEGGRLAEMVKAIGELDLVDSDERSLWLDGPGLHVASDWADVRFVLAPDAGTESWYFFCLLCCADDIQALNLLRASAECADDLRAATSDYWQPRWRDAKSCPPKLARLGGKLAGTGTQAAAACAIRLFTICNEHLAGLDRHFFRG